MRERTFSWSVLVAVAGAGCTSIPALYVSDAGAPSTNVEAGVGDAGVGDTGVGGAAPAARACICGAPGCGTCPVPRMAVLGTPPAYRIDQLEVTAGEYDAFLAAKVAPQSETRTPASCAWNTTYTPTVSVAATLPIVGVDWCDAWAYCAWTGRRLCGGLAGKPLAASELNDPSRSEWYAACGEGRPAPAYPYGQSFDAKKCNGAGAGQGALRAPGTTVDCHGSNSPYDSVLDMAGNAGEWEDSCAGAEGATDACHVRGGSFADLAPAPACHLETTRSRNATDPTTGFRCCAEL